MRHPDRVQDQPHTVVLLTEHVGVPHAFKPLDIIHHAENGIVREKDGVVSGIAGTQSHDRQQIRGYFFHRDALANDLIRDLRFRQLFAVLCLDLGNIHVRPDLEREPDGHVAIVGAGGVVVEEIVNAGELHFDGARHRIRYHLRARAGIVGIDLDHRRRNFRKLSNWEGLQGHKAYHHDDDGEDRRKDGAIDEKARTHFVCSVLVPVGWFAGVASATV